MDKSFLFYYRLLCGSIVSLIIIIVVTIQPTSQAPPPEVIKCSVLCSRLGFDSWASEFMIIDLKYLYWLSHQWSSLSLDVSRNHLLSLVLATATQSGESDPFSRISLLSSSSSSHDWFIAGKTQRNLSLKVCFIVPFAWIIIYGLNCHRDDDARQQLSPRLVINRKLFDFIMRFQSKLPLCDTFEYVSSFYC